MRKHKVGDIIKRDNKKFKLIKIAQVESKKYGLYGVYEHWHRWVKSRKKWSKTPSFYKLVT